MICFWTLLIYIRIDTLMTIKLNIGYVATAIAPYYSNEYKVREKSEASLKKLLGNFDVNFIPFHKTIFSKKDSLEAEKFFKNKVDFLLLQTSSCSSGEQLYPLCNITDKMGIWAVPDIEVEGDVKLHSLVSTSHYLAMIKKVLSDKDITTKWFYNYADTDEFINKFLAKFPISVNIMQHIMISSNLNNYNILTEKIPLEHEDYLRTIGILGVIK